MKIALVAPSPVPFAIGGAENLWASWLAAFNAAPGVQADLIKLPSPEADFWSIIDSYRQFCELDLQHFDRVISTKYPAWMVAHPDHHVYLQHTLRGLYDSWPADLSPEVPAADAAPVAALLSLLARARGSRDALPDIFASLAALRAARETLPLELFTLPGALLRQVVHTLDSIGLARQAVRRYAAISHEVAARPAYFPPEVDRESEVEVWHHPTLTRPPPDPDMRLPAGAIFTASRLDAPKRLDLIIRAYQQSDLGQPLVIAGEGPQRAELEALAEQGCDVRLLGRLDDAALAAAYRQAAFVVFVPQREDYGLITLEALQAGRPVLTCSDSGGVLELVRDGENGLVSAPEPAALAGAMRRLATEPGLQARLARSAKGSVAHIQWPPLVKAFTGCPRRLLVVNTFSALPAMSGGQLRLFHLYSELARLADVHLVNLDHNATEAQTRWLAPGLRETRVPMSAEHRACERALSARLGASSVDMAAALHPELSPEWLTAIARAADTADMVILSHPYGWPALQACDVSLPTVYEAHNVEADLKASLFTADAPELAAVRRIEGSCARTAQAVVCCSVQDAARMQELYDLPQCPEVVANGVAAHSYTAPETASREALRERLGLAPAQSLAVFVGSLHGPNVEAALALPALARACPDTVICLIGSVCEAPELGDLAPLPGNLWRTGRVSHAELRVWLAAADVGLNPVRSGSGTNLKLLEYAAAGLPILSTPFGGRGGLLRADEHFMTAEPEGFADALRTLLAAPAAPERSARADAARRQARGAGDWRHIAKSFWRVLEPVLCD
ncbi:glycosyltransferase family 4 protein [Chromatocurvus halotolerans]|uniref:Glycosyltransferase involved in cell wall biosynthesis n=1 Tax=Chromatocurvus halotolerans TaxID=1132028 RepID=A0A4R2KJC7_9GAMM|nr:glycosyltransferase family 4 protein [Chromatocurvus halotolerans]TCO73753.1 glycosyltransferase involved in cell wall biosynthesis [Chromatocurvus halotolerans]